MVEIFGQKSTQQDFDLLLQQLQEAAAQADKDPLAAGHIGKEIADVRQKGKISEADFVRIADESDGVIWESSPGRLAIPEIRHLRSQVTRFGDLARVLEKYGYSESAVFNSLVQPNPARFETLETILKQSNFQLADMPPNLRNDKHFIIALLQQKNEFYDQLSPQEKKDRDFAIHHIRSRVLENGVFGLRYRESHLFELIPDSLRFDPKFLTECAAAVAKDYGHNAISPGNFDYFWFKELGWPPEPQDPTLLPPQLKNFQFWVDLYNGDKEQAFEVAIGGGMVPEAILKNEYLARPDASRFYQKLSPQRKLDENLSRIALAHDPKTALYLPKGSSLLENPQTWFGLIADPKIRYWREPGPDFPEQLLDNADLLNRMVSSHPELLGGYSDQPEKLRKILSQLTPENTIVFVSAYSEALDLLPDAKQKDLDFAKKVVELDSFSSAAEKLFSIHGAQLVLGVISKNGEAISSIPKNVLELPEVDKAIRDQIQACQEKTIPYWASEYLKKHPEQLDDLMQNKPDWFVALLGYYDQGDSPKERLHLQLVKKNFSSLINTPERMKIYLDACCDLNSPISDIREALSCYNGEITNDVSRAARLAAYTAVGGYKNPHPAYPGDVVSLLISKYHIVPKGLEGVRIMTFVTSNDADSLMALLENSHVDLPNDGVARVYHAIKNNPEKIFAAAKVDPRILQSVSESEWKQLGPSLLQLIDGDLGALALLYPLMPADLRGDRNLALRAVISDSDNYFYLPQSLFQNQEFVTELCGWAAVPAYDLQKMAPAAQSAAIARFPFQFHLLDQQLLRDQKFVQESLAQNIWLFNELTRSEQTELWPGFKEQLEQRGFVYTDVNSWENFVNLLQIKSASPKRIRSLDGWMAAYSDLFSAGRKPGTKGNHRILMVVSKEDWNGAFASVPVIDRLVALGITNIDYREVDSESDVKRIINEAKDKGKTYNEVFIAGHGTQDSLALGGHDRARSTTSKIDDEAYIDYSDFDAGDFDFGSILKSGGQLIDFSCSNGQGAENEDNLANRFATTLNADQTVVASQVPTNITYMDKDASGRIHLYWMGNTPYLAQGTRTLKR